MAVLHHAGAGGYRAGDGLLRIRDGRPGALSLRLHVRLHPGRLGGGGRAGHAGADARGREPLQLAALHLSRRLHHRGAPGAGVPDARFAPHASLDSLWRLLHLSAVGDREAGPGAVSGVVSAHAAGRHARLEAHAAARGDHSRGSLSCWSSRSPTWARRWCWPA